MMKSVWIGLSVLSEAPGDGGGGGATGGAPDGGQSSTPAAPTAIDMDDNALIRIKGSDKPVKFGEHVRGFQSQWTKAAQKAAGLEKQLQERNAEIARYREEQQRAQIRPQQGQGQPDPLDELAKLPYLSGQDARRLVQGIGEQIKQRDQVLLGVLKKMQQIQGTVGGLHNASSNQAFEGKITRWLSEGGYPPEAKNLAKEIYLAYEGDDLDDEFPRIFGERWSEIEKIIEARKAAAVAGARKQPFIPGKGGNAHPSKPLDVKANSSSKELADLLFSGMSETGT